jgi:AhpC/TSA family
MTPHSGFARHVAAALTLALAPSLAYAQAEQTATPAPPTVGQMAPDFSLAGATRYGLLVSPVKLSDFRGKTVVIAFFFKARTKG